MSRSLVSFRLTDDLRQALKERANAEGISITELVNRLLWQGLSSEKNSFTVEARLSELEITIQQILKRFEFERRMREAFSEPEQILEKRLAELEERLQQVSSGVEESHSRIEQLFESRNQIEENCQETHKNRNSLDELQQLMKSKE